MGAAVERVLDAVRDGGLLVPGRPVVVMFSGGRDSTCLLDVALTLARERAGITALHVNHGLRPDAGADEEHCASLCGELGVELAVVRAPARPAGGNLQAWARDVRYDAGFAAAAGRGALLAAGHTASDQAETILYRLAASPGRRALLGMRARRGDLVRPLLDVSREQTTAYCRERGLEWIEDASNDSDLYARARVRHGLLPALRAVHPAAEASVLRTSDALRAEAEVLDELVDDVLGSDQAISLERLAGLSPALARLVLTRLAERAAPDSPPAAGRRLAELLALGGGGGTSSIDLGGGVVAVVEYGELRLQAPARPAPLATPLAPVQLSVPGSVRFGTWEIECATVAGSDARARTGARARAGVEESGSDAAQRALLDLGTLGPTLTVRPWRHGDRMRPLGLDGSKALSDLFIDRRVPRSRRAVVPVITSASEIVWVPGVAISEAARIGAGTERAAELIARPA
jgi:tRNA(Ile)-lysidine synthase